MSDRWLKPDFQEIGVAGECTAYAGTQAAYETNSLPSAVRQEQERTADDGERMAEGG